MLVTKKFDKEENRIVSIFRKQVTLFIASFLALVKLASMWHNKRAYNTFLTLRISTLLQMYLPMIIKCLLITFQCFNSCCLLQKIFMVFNNLENNKKLIKSNNNWKRRFTTVNLQVLTIFTILLPFWRPA